MREGEIGGFLPALLLDFFLNFCVLMVFFVMSGDCRRFPCLLSMALY